MKSIEDVLKQYIIENNIIHKQKDIQAYDAFVKLQNDNTEYLLNTHIKYIKEGILYLSVTDSMVIFQLSMKKTWIINTINKSLGAKILKDIKLEILN